MGPTLEHLRHASAREAAVYFADTDPVDIVEAVRATSDEQLLELIGREDVRPVAVQAIVARLHEYAVPERLAEIDGVVRFDLERRGVLLERHGLAFDHGAVKHLPDPPDDQPVDVVLRTSVLRFIRLVSGERNTGLEYLSGKVDIDGDAPLALAIGGLFRVPGTDDVAVDPRALDPVDVATALKDTRPDHLRKVMGSGFRPIVLEEIFRRLPSFVNERKARHVDLTIAFRLEGHPSGEVERYVVRVADGAGTVTAGADEDAARDATVTCEAHDFLRLATGNLSAITGVLRGQLNVRGDKAKALQLSSVIDFPKAR
jgi:putative sterol carrier protein